MTRKMPFMTIDYCWCLDPLGHGEVGLVMEDGGVRVDYHGDLSALTFWEVNWTEPKNPWKGGRIIGQYPKKLIPRYS